MMNLNDVLAIIRIKKVKVKLNKRLIYFERFTRWGQVESQRLRTTLQLIVTRAPPLSSLSHAPYYFTVPLLYCAFTLFLPFLSCYVLAAVVVIVSREKKIPLLSSKHFFFLCFWIWFWFWRKSDSSKRYWNRSRLQLGFRQLLLPRWHLSTSFLAHGFR